MSGTRAATLMTMRRRLARIHAGLQIKADNDGLTFSTSPPYTANPTRTSEVCPDTAGVSPVRYLNCRGKDHMKPLSCPMAFSNSSLVGI